MGHAVLVGKRKTALEEPQPGHVAGGGNVRNSRCVWQGQARLLAKGVRGHFSTPQPAPDSSFWSQCLKH